MKEFKNLVIYVVSVILAFITGACAVVTWLNYELWKDNKHRKSASGGRISYRRYYDERHVKHENNNTNKV